MNLFDTFKLEKEYNEKFEKHLKEIKLLIDIKISGKDFIEIGHIISKQLSHGYYTQDEYNLMISRYLVEIAYQYYDERKYWDFVFENIDVEKNNHDYNILKNIFIKTLKKYSLPVYKGSKARRYITNILLHTYVPKNYLVNFYEFLQNFYKKEMYEKFEIELAKDEIKALQFFLEKHIEHRETEIEIVNLHEKPTIYKLLKPMRVSFYSNPLIMEEFLIEYLKIFDSLWWGFSFPDSFLQDEKLLNLKEWYEKSGDSCRVNRNHTKRTKSFYKPTLYLERENLHLFIPRQKIQQEQYINGLEYQIKFKKKILKKGMIHHFSSMGRILTEPLDIVLEGFYGGISIEIVSGGKIINTPWVYNLPFITFDDKRVEIDPCKIIEGKHFILGESTIEVVQGNNFIKEDECLWSFYMEQGNTTVIRQNNSIFRIGKIEKKCVVVGEVLKGIKPFLKNLPIYSKPPVIFYNSKIDSDEIRVELNEEKYHLSDFGGCYEIKEDGLYLDLLKIVDDYQGIINISIVNIRTGNIILNEDFYIFYINHAFDKDVYFFEKTAYLEFCYPGKISHFYKQCNSKISIPLDNRLVELTLDDKIPVQIDVPVFKWRLKEKEWSLNFAEIWYEDFRGIFSIKMSGVKNAKLCVGGQEISGKTIKEEIKFDIDKVQDIFNSSNLIEYDCILNFVLNGQSRSVLVANVLRKLKINCINIGYIKKSQQLFASWKVLGKGKYIFVIYDMLDNEIFRSMKLHAGEDFHIVEKILLPPGDYLIKYFEIIDKSDGFFGINEISYEEFHSSNFMVQKEPSKLRIESISYEGNKHPVRSFYIESITREEKGIFSGEAYYVLNSLEKRYFIHNNPFRFTISDDIILDLVDINGEEPIYDSKLLRIRTDEPKDDEKNYERLLIADKYYFNILEE